MLTFNATLYNLTSREEVYSGEFSFGKYVGSSDVVNMPLQVINGVDIDVSYNAGSNVARNIEQAAKFYRHRMGVWPVLRLYVYRQDSLCFQWNHNNPNDLTLISSRGTKQLVNALQWNDENSWDKSIFSFTWTTVDAISDLLNYPGDVQFGSIYNGLPIPEVTSSTPATIKISNMLLTVQNASNVLVTDENTELVYATITGTYFSGVKKFGGPAYFYGTLQNNEATDGPGTRPAINRRAGTMGFYPAKRNPTNIMTWLGSHTGASTDTTITYKNKPWSVSWLTLFYNSNKGNIDKMTSWGWSTLHIPWPGMADFDETFTTIADVNEYDYDTYSFDVYYILTDAGHGEPGSDVDPEDPDAPTPSPSQPDDQDPYYDPESDPKNPEYDPTKDPKSPKYDPTQPHTPHRPPSSEDGGDPPVQPPQDPVPVPEIPPAFVTNNSMFTLYNPSAGDLNALAGFLWSPQWSIDTFKKILANPLDCILGLMVMPYLSAPTDTKEMAVGNIASGVVMRYFTNQFYDFDCGTFKIEEFYASYLDYAPYTKVNIFLPYIGDQQLDTDEVMNKVIGVKYRFDIATGDCVAFISVDGNVLYSYSGNCASRLPLSGNNWSGMVSAFTGAVLSKGAMAAGVPALGAGAALAVTSMKQDISHTGSMVGSAGLMGIQKPYLIITRPRQALPLGQNSFTGYPSFMTESLGSLNGYTEVESCHLEHIPCTGEELEEIERLLKEGVLF